MATSSRAEKQTLPITPFKSARAWETWLAANHAASNGVWLKIAKTGAGIASVSYAEALEVALCYGWIDGQKNALDDSFWLQKFTPRTARSKWSKINRAKALALSKSKRMKPAGHTAIKAAQRDGRWDEAYDAQSTATVPADLQRALDRNRKAAAFFATLSSRNRYAILHRIHSAKKPETRARRIAQFVDMLARHETLHPQPG
jgi:uncharacterized protein YdeI (YjbR/CyaY-like superfamily)